MASTARNVCAVTVGLVACVVCARDFDMRSAALILADEAENVALVKGHR
jgi:hypothetical protein